VWHSLRDYFTDIEAVVASKNPAFRLSSLSVWEDIIQPPSIPKVLEEGASADLLAAQEKALDSKFNEVKILLAADCEVMSKFNAEKKKVVSKTHVAKVMHEKTQNETGRKLLSCKNFACSVDGSCFLSVCDIFFRFRVVDEYMANFCWMGLVAENNFPTEVDVFLRATAARHKVGLIAVIVTFFLRALCRSNLMQ